VIREGKRNVHWNLFLALDNDIGVLSRYVELARRNESVFSIELASLLFSAASEVDVVAKILCKSIDPQADPENIDAYRKLITKAHPDLHSFRVDLPRHGLSFDPWSNWAKGKNPDWWTSYNKVKHERDKHFALANLKNTLNAVAGLYVVLIYAFADEARSGALVPNPTLFAPPTDRVSSFSFNLNQPRIEYKV
jgi:hypothetical protein